MEAIAGYVRNIFCLYIIITIVDNLIANEKYARYIKLFSGILMIIVVIRPVAAFLGMESVGSLMDFQEEYSLSENVYAAILAAEQDRDEAIIEAYLDTVQDQIGIYAGQWGYEVISAEIDLNLDTESEGFGSVVRIKAELSWDAEKNAAGDFASDTGVYEGYDIISIKNNLANFYNLPVSNIYINIYDRQDYKEGA